MQEQRLWQRQTVFIFGVAHVNSPVLIIGQCLLQRTCNIRAMHIRHAASTYELGCKILYG